MNIQLFIWALLLLYKHFIFFFQTTLVVSHKYNKVCYLSIFCLSQCVSFNFPFDFLTHCLFRSMFYFYILNHFHDSSCYWFLVSWHFIGDNWYDFNPFNTVKTCFVALYISWILCCMHLRKICFLLLLDGKFDMGKLNQFIWNTIQV
jgi:hypothetical protein